ncbi:hypothetical protein BGW38_000345 [Lunasporangiospora selenospora]|uniref:RRM domain-containing protein n=1 Tax=Lunasporangiospora selenospora TaxID=979761 RepID=A0A9P6KF11_9FUNG|nr:hypothetical protein BGW38_000345 [Lunasporangiospora selenospora]
MRKERKKKELVELEIDIMLRLTHNSDPREKGAVEDKQGEQGLLTKRHFFSSLSILVLPSTFRCISLVNDASHEQDKFGPPAGGSRGSSHPSSSRYERDRGSSYRGEDYSRGGNSGGYGDSYGYGNSGGSNHDYRHGPRGRHHDVYDGSSRSGGHHGGGAFGNDASMESIPSGPAAGSGDQVYIRNLPLTTTDQDLVDLFRTCGQIRRTEILLHNGRPKGSGVVRFEHFDSADKAVAKFNGYTYGGRPLEIMYDRA